MRIAGVSAGAVTAKALASKVLPAMSGKIKGAALMIGGAILPELSKRNAFLSDAGSGVIAVGALTLAAEFIPGIVSGIGEDPNQGIGAENAVEFDLSSEEKVQGVDGPDNGIGAIEDVEDTSY